MRRGTTPTVEITLREYQASALSNATIYFAQGGAVVITKKLSDCTTSGYVLSVPLAESETLAFDDELPLEVQIRGVLSNGKIIASNIMKGSVGRILWG